MNVRDVTVAAASTRDSDTLLRVTDLSVVYRGRDFDVHAVTGATLTVASGRITAVIGETGSGKSSLVRTVLGLLPANAAVTSGAVSIRDGDRDVDLLALGRKQLRGLRGRAIGFVPQSTRGALNPVLTIADHFESTFRAHGIRHKAWPQRAANVLQSVGFVDPERVLASYAHQLSGGMAQRVVLALAVCLDPGLLVADEPTSGLDASVKQRVMAELTAQARERGRGVVMVTHDVDVVRRSCDDVIVMYGGAVIESGPVSEVLGSPQHPYTKALLGAVPRRGVELQPLPGSAAPQLGPLTRCTFYDRCPVKSERCAHERPTLRDVGGGHRVATFCDTPVEVAS